MHQEQLDLISTTKGKNRYSEKLGSLVDYRLESRSSYGLRLSSFICGKVSESIAKTVRGYSCESNRFKPAWLQWMDGLPCDVVAWITCETVLDTITQEANYSTVLLKLGEKLETEWIARQLKADHPKLYFEAVNKSQEMRLQGIRRNIRQAILARATEAQIQAWNPIHRDTFADFLISILRRQTGMVTVQGKGEKQTISPTPETKEWIADHKAKEESYRVVHMPMVERPGDWKGMRDGGHTSLNWKPSLVRRRNRCGEISFEDVGETAIGACNKLQSVAWRVNKPMLELLQWAFRGDHEIGKLPRATLHDMSEIPNEQFYQMTVPQRDEYIRNRKRLHTLNNKIAMGKVNTLSYLSQCKLIQDEKVYFPVSMDYRGRMYMKPMSPQGVDYVRSLFEFHEGKKLDNMGIEWLAVHGANLWGERGCKWTRVDWVRRHERQILECADNPYDAKWWHEAKKPWCFLAFCKEWKGVVEQGTDFVSHLPVQMDGSCNGAQILSLLLADTSLASKCNVLPSKDQEPQDIYAAALEDVLDILCEHEDELLRESWFKIGLDRDAIKSVVMNIPNGQSLYSATSALIDFYDKYVDAGGQDFFNVGRKKACEEVATIIYQACDKIMAGVKLLRMRLENMVQEMHEESSAPIRWKSPSGFTVSQKYIKEDGHIVETLYNGEKHRLASYYQSDEVDVEKSARAIMPNLIHSHDAAIAHKVVTSSDLDCIATIHDCYMTHAVDAQRLNDTILRVVRDTYVGKNWIEDLCQQVEFEFDLTELPERGDLSGVVDAEYMFS